MNEARKEVEDNMKFLELHHGENKVVVRADLIVAVADFSEDTAVYIQGDKRIFYVDESVEEVLGMVREAMA